MMPTHLGSIAMNHLAVECGCGRSELVAVADLLPERAELTVDEAMALMRCARCGARAVRECWIVYVGGSAMALEGTRRPD